VKGEWKKGGNGGERKGSRVPPPPQLTQPCIPVGAMHVANCYIWLVYLLQLLFFSILLSPLLYG